MGSPDFVEVAGEQLDCAVYQLLTIAENLIVRMDEYRTRDEGLEAMRLRREAFAGAPGPLERAPSVPIDDLIPFVHVADRRTIDRVL